MIPARIESAVQTFNFEGKAPVRTVIQRDEPWFVAADVCAVLDHSNAREAIKGLDEDERDAVSIPDAMGREQETNLISESGLYTLIMRSRKPQAKPFRRWVTHEVLPALRKEGHYEAPVSQPALADLQAQMTELRTLMESKAVRLGPPKKALDDLRTTELALTVAHNTLGDVLDGLHRVMHRYGIRSVGDHT